MFQNQWHLCLAFFRVGILGYGGGPSSIPLVQKEVVDTYKWMDEEEFTNLLAVANALPGPIGTKMAGYIGYRVGGFIGLCNAVISTILPTIVAMIILLTFLSSMSEKPWVQGMTKAVVPVVGVMLFVLTIDFLKKAKSGLGWSITVGLFIVSFLFVEVAGLHPAILIGLLILAALFSKNREKERERAS
ncbi:chromate transporter [Radiobacillus kanasensis]|uniref:chromate transporter n=1 Tax=Radiobacillus kanasensis TaxID=2844358 RepID=UPI001E642548|nr:chromate transporter [Radiobacillus kanasensis]UFT98575.1 chromate transporter [Radiobacillus kanasensis]